MAAATRERRMLPTDEQRLGIQAHFVDVRDYTSLYKRRLLGHPGLHRPPIDLLAPRNCILREPFLRQRMHLSIPRLSRGLAEVPALVVWVIGVIARWQSAQAPP